MTCESLDRCHRLPSAMEPEVPWPDTVRRYALRAQKRQWLVGVVAAGLAVLVPTAAMARPEAPSALCAAYPEAEICAGRVAECSICHTSTEPPSWNGFGLQILDVLQLGDDYATDLAQALADIENLDGDGDGIDNLAEILTGTAPGDANEGWPYCVAEEPDVDSVAPDVPVPASYDFAVAYRRASVRICGQSPDFAQLSALEADQLDRAQGYRAVHDLVAACLDSAYWRDQALHRIADSRIRPLLALSADSPIGFVAADYAWDYRLFAYVMTGDRDVRDLLLADYHVQANDDGTLYPVPDLQPPRPDLPPEGPGGQPLAAQYRAGMLTTQWFLMLNVASALPRTAAALAYRGYLGTDIAKLQGIRPVVGEPLDIDGAGVDAPNCAVCHSTLDPLSYAFAEFDGFPIDNPIPGLYNPDRPRQLLPDWNDNQSVVLGQTVTSLREWAQSAVASDEFRRTIGTMAFSALFGRQPTVAERPMFNTAWRALPEDGWSFNQLIHRFVDFAAFGGAQ